MTIRFPLSSNPLINIHGYAVNYAHDKQQE